MVFGDLWQSIDDPNAGDTPSSPVGSPPTPQSTAEGTGQHPAPPQESSCQSKESGVLNMDEATPPRDVDVEKNVDANDQQIDDQPIDDQSLGEHQQEGREPLAENNIAKVYRCKKCQKSFARNSYAENHCKDKFSWT